MIIYIFITQMMLLIISYSINKKNIFKWILLFNVWWLLLLLFNIIVPYGGYKSSVIGETFVWIFLIFTTVGYTFPRTNLKKRYKNFSLSKDKKNLEKNFKKLITKSIRIKILMFLLDLILIIYAIRYSNYIQSTSVLNSRIARFYVGGVFHSTIELLFFNYVIATSRFFAIFIIVYGVIYKEFKNILFLLSIINVFLYSFIGGSRFPIVMLGVETIILFLYQKQFIIKKISIFRINLKKIKEKIIFLTCIFVIMFIMMYFTAYRLGMIKFSFELLIKAYEALYKQCIGYNIGPIAALDKLLNDGTIKNNFYFGKAVLLNGIDEVIYNIFSIIKLPYHSARYTLGTISNESIILGNNSFNALYTCIFWFYSDMGMIGVIFYSLLFGFFVGHIVREFDYKATLWKLMLFLHILYFFIMSNINWEINTVDSLVYILFILLYFRKKERRI